MDKVSLYIPAYNAEAFLVGCLESVLAQTLPPDEILVIDDGSQDYTAMIAAHFPVTYIRHAGNRGLAAARNTAVRAARNEIVASLDSDCVPQPGWLERLAAHFADPKVAAVGGKLVERVQDSVADRWRAVHMQQHWGEQQVRNPRFMFGNNIALRKSVVAESGWYDERLRTNGEDSNMSTRIAALGYDTFYEPSAVVHHMRRDTVDSVLETFWRYRRDYYHPVTWPKVWRNFRYQYFGSARYVLQEDWRERRFSLLWMDALMLIHSPYCDLRMILNSAPAAPQETQSSEV